MDEDLRPDLLAWLEAWEARADLCLAMGTSLCGMAADCVAEACARSSDGFMHRCCGAGGRSDDLTEAGRTEQGGLVIINLQRTKLDGNSSLRIFGTTDEVMRLLVCELLGPVKKQRARKTYRCSQSHMRNTRDGMGAGTSGCRYRTQKERQVRLYDMRRAGALP